MPERSIILLLVNGVGFKKGVNNEFNWSFISSFYYLEASRSNYLAMDVGAHTSLGSYCMGSTPHDL